MEHFKGSNPSERFYNEMMNHMRKQTELLEQIAQLLQPSELKQASGMPTKRSYTRRK